MRRTILILSVLTVACLLGVRSSAAQRGTLYLVPILATPDLLDALSAYYQQNLALDVQILPALEPRASTFDPDRRQFVAEELVKQLRTSQGGNSRLGAVIGVTSKDMYIRELSWRFAFSLREPPYAVVSYARMDPVVFGRAPDRDLLLKRLRKMVTRNVGIMIFGLPRHADPTNLMYRNVLGVDDLDKLDEDLSRAGFPVR
jgi:predicted Zn-dependent protease